MKSLLHLIVAALLVTSVFAENWPRFRGPNGQGISTETNLPMEWSVEKNIAWKTPIPGDGWSSPIVWDDRVFVTSTTDNGTRCHVICVDTKSGKILWATQVFEQFVRRKENKNSHATPTPVTDGKKVYATFGDGSIVAVTFDGAVAWTNREVKFYSRHGLGSSPIVHEELVIQPYDGSQPVEAAGNYPQVSTDERTGWQLPWDKSFIAALNTKTGKRVWTGKRGMSRISHVTPIVAHLDGKDQIISGAGDRMQGFDPKTGELIWSVYQQGEGVSPSPALGDGMLFASSGFEKTTLRGIKLGSARGDLTESHIAWEQKKGVPTQPSPIFVKPFLYAITDGGIASCFKPENGEIVWQERVGGNFSASPVHAGGHIYFLNEAGETTVIASGTEFKVLAKNKIEGRCQASMAVSGGRFFIRTDKQLFCIGL
ncbi:MAG TPA: PQQ-binding-like beta-propeller repeat protein, partial [Candidatus Acidoferrum sp.]|nr:PQQ-binding-like beta-propeller repeat protein [Candidatus Acidoferrum sp.]